jgi:hypothetical protein
MMMIMVAGICFMLFIGFNYAYNSSGVLKNQLWKSANNTLDGRQLDQFNDLMPQITQGFGIASVMCFLLAIVMFAVQAFYRPPNNMGY